MIFFLLVLLLSTSAYNIFSNVMLGTGCHSLDELQKNSKIITKELKCEKNWITIFSLANKRTQGNLTDL